MKSWIAVAVAAVIAFGLVSCGDGTDQGGKVKVRWFVGLGAGSDAPTLEPQQNVVKKFNESQNEIELVLEIVDNNQAYDTLSTQISGGNAPDIVGPVGIRGRDSFKGAWLDLDPLIKSTNYDLSAFDSAMIDFYRDRTEGQVGLPFAIYPSFLYVNKELFEEAGIPLPPQKYGDPYIDADGNQKPWDVNTLREISMKLTVDENGNDATSRNFNPEKIVQWGFGEQWGDARGIGTLFGAGSFADANGNAQIPPQWLKSWKWYYDGMWKDHFVPTGPYGSTDILAQGDWFSSGRLAIDHIHLWYAGFAKLNFDWDTAVVPSADGTTTAKMHADTFMITKYSKNPDAAFKVLAYLLDEGAVDLLPIYGGMPARKSLQGDFLSKFGQEKFPGKDINWQVVADSINYVDNPNHESWMPSFQETSTRYGEFWSKLGNEPGLNVEAEAQILLQDLQKIFAAAAGK